jgi:hypothetical protein
MTSGYHHTRSRAEADIVRKELQTFLNESGMTPYEFVNKMHVVAESHKMKIWKRPDDSITSFLSKPEKGMEKWGKDLIRETIRKLNGDVDHASSSVQGVISSSFVSTIDPPIPRPIQVMKERGPEDFLSIRILDAYTNRDDAAIMKVIGEVLDLES